MFLAQYLIIHHRVASRIKDTQSSSFMVRYRGMHVLVVIGIVRISCGKIFNLPYKNPPLKRLAYIVIFRTNDTRLISTESHFTIRIICTWIVLRIDYYIYYLEI